MTPKQITELKVLRSYLIAHPGCTCKELYAKTGITSGIMKLESMNLARPSRNKSGTVWYARPMSELPEDFGVDNLEHPDSIIRKLST